MSMRNIYLLSDFLWQFRCCRADVNGIIRRFFRVSVSTITDLKIKKNSLCLIYYQIIRICFDFYQLIYKTQKYDIKLSSFNVETLILQLEKHNLNKMRQLQTLVHILRISLRFPVFSAFESHLFTLFIDFVTNSSMCSTPIAFPALPTQFIKVASINQCSI